MSNSWVSTVHITNTTYDSQKNKLVVQNLKKMIAEYKKTNLNKPISERYAIYIITVLNHKKERFLSEVWMFDYIENHAMRDSSWMLPYSEENKRELVDWFLKLMNCADVLVPVLVNGWDPNVAKTFGVFPPWETIQNQEENKNSELNEKDTIKDKDSNV